MHLDAMKGIFVLSGRSIPIDAEVFYRPILAKIDELSLESPEKIEFCFRFDFFNIASSKRILFILYKLADLQKSGTQVLVRWMYERFDEDMLEIGQDYNLMIDEVNFLFEEYDSLENKKKAAVKLS